MLTTGFACATRAVNQPNEILRLHLAQTTLCSASSTGRIVVEVEASYYGGWDHLGPSNSVSSPALHTVPPGNANGWIGLRRWAHTLSRLKQDDVRLTSVSCLPGWTIGTKLTSESARRCPMSVLICLIDCHMYSIALVHVSHSRQTATDPVCSAINLWFYCNAGWFVHLFLHICFHIFCFNSLPLTCRVLDNARKK